MLFFPFTKLIQQKVKVYSILSGVHLLEGILYPHCRNKCFHGDGVLPHILNTKGKISIRFVFSLGYVARARCQLSKQELFLATVTEEEEEEEIF